MFCGAKSVFRHLFAFFWGPLLGFPPFCFVLLSAASTAARVVRPGGPCAGVAVSALAKEGLALKIYGEDELGAAAALEGLGAVNQVQAAIMADHDD